MRFIIFIVLSAPLVALGGQIVQCPDGSYREAPCPGAQRQAAPPAPAPAEYRDMSCNPQHPQYNECRRELKALQSRERELARAQTSEIERQRMAQQLRPTYGGCSILQGAGERAECERTARNKNIHDRQLRDMKEADRQARKAAAAADRANRDSQAQQRADAAHRAREAAQAAARR